MPVKEFIIKRLESFLERRPLICILIVQIIFVFLIVCVLGLILVFINN